VLLVVLPDGEARLPKPARLAPAADAAVAADALFAPCADSAGEGAAPDPVEGLGEPVAEPSAAVDSQGIRRAALASDPELIDPSQPPGWGAALASDLDTLLRALAARRGE
jgi:hypothetical protein